jgi:hypothetical protein
MMPGGEPPTPSQPCQKWANASPGSHRVGPAGKAGSADNKPEHTEGTFELGLIDA